MTTPTGDGARSSAPHSTKAEQPDLKETLNRLSGWMQAARRVYGNMEPLSTITDGAETFEFWQSDLHDVYQAARGWEALQPAFTQSPDTGPDGVRTAIQNVKRFTNKFHDAVLKDRPKATISCVDGAELYAHEIDFIAHRLDFVDTIIRKHQAAPQPADPVDLDQFTPPMLDRLGQLEESVYADLAIGRLRTGDGRFAAAAAAELHRRAALEWPGITRAQSARAAAALILHTLSRPAAPAMQPQPQEAAV